MDVRGLSVSADGRVAFVADYQPRLWALDLQQKKLLAAWYPPGAWIISLSCLGNSYDCAVGQTDGRLQVARLENGPTPGPAIVTAARLWHMDRGPMRQNGEVSLPDGRWDDQITAGCPRCRKRFSVAPRVVEVIRSLTKNLSPDQSPCLVLSKEAWEEPGLADECDCGQAVIFNPFLVDQKERLADTRHVPYSAG